MSISEARSQEHINASINHVKFNGSPETIPYEVGDLYDDRKILAIGCTKNLYGNYYHLIVDGDRTHMKSKFEFDEDHNLRLTKPLHSAQR